MNEHFVEMVLSQRLYKKNASHPACLLAIIFISLVSLNTVFARLDTGPNANSSSRLAQIDALIHHHTWSIESSVFRDRGDRAFINGHYVSEKPPMLSVLASGPYWLYWKLSGISFYTNEWYSVLFISLLTGLFVHAFLLFYFYLFLDEFVSHAVAKILGFGGIAFGYFGILFSGGISNHTVAALALFAGYYHAFQCKKKLKSCFHPVMAGLWAGLLPTFDYASAIFSIGLTVYFFLSSKNSRLAFLVTATIPLIYHFLFNISISGSVVPVYLCHECFVGYDQGIDGARDPGLVCLFHILIGHSGIFAMSPLAIIGLFVTFHRAFIRKELDYLWYAVSFILVVLAYAFILGRYAGFTAGFRFLVPILPIFILFAVKWIDRPKVGWRELVYAICINIGWLQIVWNNPWELTRWYHLFEWWGLANYY